MRCNIRTSGTLQRTHPQSIYWTVVSLVTGLHVDVVLQNSSGARRLHIAMFRPDGQCL